MVGHRVIHHNPFSPLTPSLKIHLLAHLFSPLLPTEDVIVVWMKKVWVMGESKGLPGFYPVIEAAAGSSLWLGEAVQEGAKQRVIPILSSGLKAPLNPVYSRLWTLNLLGTVPDAVGDVEGRGEAVTALQLPRMDVALLGLLICWLASLVWGSGWTFFTFSLNPPSAFPTLGPGVCSGPEQSF